MSDTPRTDYEIEVNQLDRFEADWPRKLERECDKLAKQCVKNVEEIGELRAALLRLERERDGARACLKSWKEDEGADAARFDWLINHAGGVVINLDDNFMDRESIDAAMEAANND